jgi:hypothetical protein
MSGDRIVAIGLLRERDLQRLGDAFRDFISVPDEPVFEDLLAKLDQIEVEQFGKGIVIRPELKV